MGREPQQQRQQGHNRQLLEQQATQAGQQPCLLQRHPNSPSPHNKPLWLQSALML
jgi:hypothetical protein